MMMCMTEYPNSPTPQNGNSPYASASYGVQQPYTAPPLNNGKKPKNKVGLVALALAVVGFILGCIPGIMFLGWVLLFAAFVTGVVGLFQKFKEKLTSILAIVISILGSIASTIVLFFVIANAVASNPDVQKSFEELEASISATATPEAPAAPSTPAEEKTEETQTSAPATEAKNDDVPREHANALREAKSYLEFSGFSYAGLYDQLTSEYGGKYPAEAAQYAMDNLDVDWNAEALESAQDYIEFSDFSAAGLYDQLTSEHGEQFTPEQAQYAVDNVKADWNQEALDAARSYQEFSGMSNDRLFEQLTSEYGSQFTPEQAQYAIDNL